LKNISPIEEREEDYNYKKYNLTSPSQVLRKLIENSIDAKSSNIEIRVELSGLNIIEVKDDGIAMSPQEMMISVEKENKIKNLNKKIFSSQGKSLNRISKVSKLEIISKEKNKTRGAVLNISNDKVHPIKECYADIGTKIQVRDLFYNNANIRDIVKKSKSDDLIKIINTYALAFPEISFTAKSNNKVILDTPKEDKFSKNIYISRIKNVLGNKIIKSIINFKNETNELSVNFFYTNENNSFKRKNYQFMFINNRPVYEEKIIQIINDLYRQTFSEADYPAFVLFIESKEELLNISKISDDIITIENKNIVKMLKSLFLNAFAEEIYKDKSKNRENSNLLDNPVGFHNKYEISQSNKGLIIKDKNKNKKIEITLESIEKFFK
jgi:DNA mismatch repair protein MutL